MMTGISAFNVYKDRDDNINFYIKIQNGPVHSNLFLGVAVGTTDGLFADWALRGILMTPDGRTLWEPNEIVMDGTYSPTANTKGWPCGTYNVNVYVWEAENGPNWTPGQGLDSVSIGSAFTINVPPLPDNVNDIVGVNNTIAQGMCLPGVSYQEDTTYIGDQIVNKNGEWTIKYPTRGVYYDDYSEYDVMLATLFYLYNFGSGYTTYVRMRWYRENDGEMINEYNKTLEPGLRSRYGILGWRHKSDAIINGKGIYRREIVVWNSTGTISGTANVYFKVI